MLKLLLGRSGSGKTHYIHDAIISDCQNGTKAYFIVPEQQAYTTELDILPKLPGDAALTFSVTSFKRLAGEVFGVFGGLSYNHITEGSRKLIMWDTLRKLSGSLTEYRAQQPDAAFTSLMLSTVDNLRASGLTPELLDGICQKLKSNGNSHITLCSKLSDISAIYSAFDLNLTRVFGENPADLLDRLSETLAKHRDYFANTHIYIDSFTSFTVQEYKVLKEIIPYAAEITVSLCLDRKGGMQFSGIKDTCERLLKIARLSDTEAKIQRFENNMRTSSPELCALEKYLWEYGENPTDDERSQFGNSVSFVNATTIYTESEIAALKILELKESGIPFGRIALIMRDAESRKGITDAALEKYGIPYFLSERTDLSSKPVARLVLNAIKACSRRWQQTDIISLIKTGLCGITAKESDLFCDYCTKWNINGSKFESELWNMNPDGYTTRWSERGKEILEVANLVREKLMTPLKKLSLGMRTSGCVRDMCGKIYEYMQELDIKGQLTERAGEELERKNIREAGELVRLYDYITEALVNLCNIFPDGKMTCDEFSTALSILFASTDIGSVPDMHDCVVVGSAATMRVENIKAAVILGLNEGEFPGSPSDSGILSTADMELIAELEPDLGFTQDTSTADELLYVYRAFTLADEKLVLMMSGSRLGGNQNQPSSAFIRALEILGKNRDDIEQFSGISPKSNEEKPVDTEHSVSPDIISGIIGNTLFLSKSSLNRFAGCPYSFYCDYILKLRENTFADVSYADAGNFIHRIAERFLKKTVHEDGSIEMLDDRQTEALVDEIIEEYINDLFGSDRDILTPKIKYQFMRLRDMAIQLLKSIIKEFSDGQFRSVMYEQEMSDAPGCPNPIEIKLGDKDARRTIITGTIDRIDAWRNGEDIYIRIVDYKTSDKPFSEDEKKFADNIQLFVYLFAVCESNGLFGGLNTIPASSEYLCTEENANPPVTRNGFILDMPDVLNAASNSSDSKIVGANSKSKIKRFTSEHITELKTQMTDTIKTISNEIFSGNARRTPGKDACAFCTVKDNCPVCYKE